MKLHLCQMECNLAQPANQWYDTDGCTTPTTPGAERELGLEMTEIAFIVKRPAHNSQKFTSFGEWQNPQQVQKVDQQKNISSIPSSSFSCCVIHHWNRLKLPGNPAGQN